MAQIVRHEAHDRKEHNQDHGQREQIFHHEVWPERQRVFLRVFLTGATDLDTCGVVVAGGVERPDVDDHQTGNHEGQQIVQAEEAVQRGVINRRPAQQKRLQAFPDERDRTEQTGDNRCTPERHLTPRQNIAHKAGCHHQKIDQHADDPGDFTWRFIRPVVQAAEDVRVDRNKEQRGTIHVHVAQHIAAVHVTHNVLDACKRRINVRRVMHRQNDAGHDLQRQTERQNNAPDPHPVQVLRCRDHQSVIQQPNNGKTAMKPLLPVCFRLVMVVRNSSHSRSPLT